MGIRKVSVDLDFTAFWHSGNPAALAEYRRLKYGIELDEKVLEVVSELQRKSQYKGRKIRRKRGNRSGKKQKFKGGK